LGVLGVYPSDANDDALIYIRAKSLQSLAIASLEKEDTESTDDTGIPIVRFWDLHGKKAFELKGQASREKLESLNPDPDEFVRVTISRR